MIRPRILVGGAALGAYSWRIYDPKASYGFFFDVSDWLSSWVIAGEGVNVFFRNLIGLVLVDQLDGFLLGIAVVALFTLIAMFLKTCAKTTVKIVKGVSGKNRNGDITAAGKDPSFTNENVQQRIQRMSGR